MEYNETYINNYGKKQVNLCHINYKILDFINISNCKKAYVLVMFSPNKL